ncbi:MAG: histidine kinase [Elainellaceae cyanobacterium]
MANDPNVRNRETHDNDVHVTKRAVGVFKTQDAVEDLIRKLKSDNFPMERVSLLARDVKGIEGADEITETEGNEAKEGAGAGATTGTVLGGVGGFLVGVGLLAIPGVGPVLAAGTEISALASTFAGAGIGAATGGIVGALVGMGIPEERAKVYEDRIKAGNYLVMISGTDEEIEHISSIMRDRDVQDFDVYPVAGRREATQTTTPVATGERVEARRVEATDKTVVTDTRDLDKDGEPEVIIKEKRRDVR